jgi:hypothetical protein
MIFDIRFSLAVGRRSALPLNSRVTATGPVSGFYPASFHRFVPQT